MDDIAHNVGLFSVLPYLAVAVAFLVARTRAIDDGVPAAGPREDGRFTSTLPTLSARHMAEVGLLALHLSSAVGLVLCCAAACCAALLDPRMYHLRLSHTLACAACSILGSVPADANDHIYCTRLANNAAHSAMRGYTGVCVGALHNIICMFPQSLTLNRVGRWWWVVMGRGGGGIGGGAWEGLVRVAVCSTCMCAAPERHAGLLLRPRGAQCSRAWCLNLTRTRHASHLLMTWRLAWQRPLARDSAEDRQSRIRLTLQAEEPQQMGPSDSHISTNLE